MATVNNYVVYVPDESTPITGFPRSMGVEEVRASLVATGRTALENADVNISNDGATLRFKRVSGGTKG
jgi:hypothetical protein